MYGHVCGVMLWIRIVFMTFEMVGLSTCTQTCNMLAKFVIVCYLDFVFLSFGLYWHGNRGITLFNAHVGKPIYSTLLYFASTFSSQTNSNKTEEVFL